MAHFTHLRVFLKGGSFCLIFLGVGLHSLLAGSFFLPEGYFFLLVGWTYTKKTRNNSFLRGRCGNCPAEIKMGCNSQGFDQCLPREVRVRAGDTKAQKHQLTFFSCYSYHNGPSKLSPFLSFFFSSLSNIEARMNTVGSSPDTIPVCMYCNSCTSKDITE